MEYLFDGVVDGLQCLKSLSMKQIGEGNVHRRHLADVLQQPLLVGVRSKVPVGCSEAHPTTHFEPKLTLFEK